MADSSLIRRAGAGDPDAQDALYRQYYKKVYYLARKLTQSSEDAEDIAQDTFLAAFQALPKLEKVEAFDAWLMQIAVNRCRNRLSREARTTELPEGFEEREPDPNEALLPESVLEDEAQRTILLNIIRDLPEEQRECVLLFYYSGLSVKEIARSLSVSEGTVKSRLNYARQKIKAAVLDTERRDGIRLHSLVPFGLLLAQDFEAVTAELSVGSLSAAAAGAAASGGAASGSAAAKTGFLATLKAKVVAGVTAAAVAVGGGIAVSRLPEPITFADPALEQAVRLVLEKPDGALTEEDLTELRTVSVFDDGVSLWLPGSQTPVDQALPGTQPLSTLEDLDALPLVQIYFFSSDHALLDTLETNEGVLSFFYGDPTLDFRDTVDPATSPQNLSFLEQLPGLQNLSLFGLTEGFDLTPVEELTSLERLHLTSDALLTLHCDRLQNLRSLTSYRLGAGAQEPNILLETEQPLPNLIWLSIEEAAFDTQVLEYFPALQRLSLPFDVTDEDIRRIAALQELRVFTLQSTYRVTSLTPLEACTKLVACGIPMKGEIPPYGSVPIMDGNEAIQAAIELGLY